MARRISDVVSLALLFHQKHDFGDMIFGWSTWLVVEPLAENRQLCGQCVVSAGLQKFGSHVVETRWTLTRLMMLMWSITFFMMFCSPS